jgi:RNA polymerase sigma factor (sigma-70 family)
MSEWLQDFALLREFAREGDQGAFGDLMKRHLDLVFATALRKLDEEGAAQEVAQNVFAALARKAWRFSPDDSIPAWLHRTTLLESKHWLRGELRRRRREQTAAQLGTTMKTPDEQAAFRALLPLLDEALLSLREKDRTALLLRFYERRSLREVGGSLGVGEDAAQKRVAAALDRLASFFQRRGFKTAGSAAALAALQQSANAVPSAVAEAIIHGVLQSTPATTTGIAAWLGRIAALPKAQTVVVCLMLAGAPVSLEWSRASTSERQTLQAQREFEAAREEGDKISQRTGLLRSKLARATSPGPTSDVQGVERRAEAARNFAALKTRVLGLLNTPDYQWPDDLPFVRVPKSALRKIGSDVPAFASTGRLAPWIQEVLNLSDTQRTGVEGQLGDYLGTMDRLAASRAVQTNWVGPDGSYHNSIKVPALGQDGQLLEDALATNLVAMLGGDQAKLVMGPFSSPNQWLGAEKVSHYLITEPGEFELRVKPNDSGEPSVSMTWQRHLSTGGRLEEGSLPPFLETRYLAWLESNGLTNGVFIPAP